jgi:hypothetical protein
MKSFGVLVMVVALFAAVGCGKKDAKELTFVEGMVFEDVNENGRKDDGEKGIGGILVSNQYDVVETNRKGRYKIPLHGENATIFVIKPNSYDLPCNENMTPRFSYVHRPEGSPELKHEGLLPTGPLPESVDFPLLKIRKKSDRFDVVVFSDPQPRSNREIDYIRDDIMSELVDTEASFGIALGDIMYDDLALYDRYTRVVSSAGIPFFNVPGNHDMNYDAEDDRFALETFRRHFGPSYYAFEYGKVSFVVLDDVEWMGEDEEKGTSNYRGKLGNRQTAWLENYLEHVPKDRLIVLTMHIPLYHEGDPDESVNVIDRDDVFDLLKERKHLLAIAGHMHLAEQYDLDDAAGWMGTHRFQQITCTAVSGSWWSGPRNERGIPSAEQRDGVPNGYHVFSFDGNGYTQRFKPAGLSEDKQIRISSPTGKIRVTTESNLEVLANVFNGNEHSTVEYRLDGGEFIRMERTVTTDPFIARLIKNNRKSYPDWIEPVPALHIWTAPLPLDLETGAHTVTVRTTNEYGDMFSESSVFETE